MKRLIAGVILLISIITTTVTIPMLDYPSLLYGSKFLDANFIIEYIQAWWQKFFRRLMGQFGPAETTSPDQTASQTYTLPGPTTTTTITEPTDIYELIAVVKKNTAEYSLDILSYLEANGLPTNQTAQIDLFIIPENIYLTICWSGSQLSIYDGWMGDQEANLYLVATATSDLVMEIYENQDDLTTCRSILLQGEASGSLSYTIRRLP